ncbi:MAG: ABC transporter ATP-binding protein [Candidatus Cloacimonetes bacterium]|jgi:ABC-type Mn2+/Zn2+ transport system ATPase subunit|nr:ABC transporter ATP-binding protein [Candidatus Cloacimonadota bacterium]MDY0299684.1 ABC transporter ATP-binding protein [Candidatus Cloacimonadaceae bacterium]MCB5279222.1 ABC transporter ATP-binding protein [Candidatus Cloacimonadota bacterium]MCK9332330.1 ABC transporter ATP-binding protein [Candidatus Cloacimonadota bacterium]MDD2210557.1 ABC transporter ATP-binding protein [Candidatus Cloacimonadota bacterium]
MIQIKDLQYRVAGKSILEDINLEIPDNVFAAIIGPNGAGKSTLIKLLMGIIELQEGSILIDGIPQEKWLKSDGFGYLPQREEFDRGFPATALDIVLMGIAGRIGWGKRCTSEHRQKALMAMHECGIAEKAGEQIGNLSGGELQRVMLARAILFESRYLILDEPEAGIDRLGVSSFFKLLKKLNDAGKTIITISHDLHTLSEYCNFLICLNRRLHCHNHSELVNADVIHKTFGETFRLIEKDY